MTQEFQELQNLIKKEGKVLIAMVHPALYGPLRGLNFILENPDAKSLDSYLASGCESISRHTWEKTMMAVKPMILPNELISQMETPPIKVKTLKEGEAHIKKILAQHTMEKDAFYFRLGIL